MNTKLSALWTRGLACFVANLALELVACGDESDSDVLAENSGSAVEVVSKIDDLPICEDSNEGALAWIKGESTARVCVGGLWFAMAASDSSDLNCSTEELVDNSGKKIICNGDSIGVVLNGNNGAPGKDGKNGDSGSDCSVQQTKNSSVVEITCGSKTVSLDLNQKNVVDVDTVELDSEKIAVLLDNVSGFTQKGPYLSGSNVQVKETQDGRTLRQTGNVFDGKIQNDNGEFKINARMMTSQYVILEANGYYRDEITGDVSKSELRLLAITDVTMRRSANINLITHLEYNRVLHLVTKEKMKVWAAKRQAQKEIFALLNIDADGFSNSEDLNIAGASDEDGALLAFSILMQGNRTVAQLSEMLTKISADIEKDGNWNDSLTRKQIADWAAAADVSGMLDTIRKNVEGWKLSQVVPRFEHRIRNFWWTVYELGQCDDKNKLKVVSTPADTNPDARYICREEGRWDLATDLEKDTYGWTKDTVDGALKYGAITETKQYIFDAAQKQWREPTTEENLFGGCTEEIALNDEENVKSKDSILYIQNYGPYWADTTKTTLWYVCENHEWKKHSAYNVDTRKWSAGYGGEFRYGDYTGAGYVYDDSLGFWRKELGEEGMLKSGCTPYTIGKIVYNDSLNTYYSCHPDAIWSSDFSTCHPDSVDCFDQSGGHYCTWERDVVAGFVYPEECDRDGKMVKGTIITSDWYVCDSLFWRKATASEELNGMACTIAKQDSLYEHSGEYIVCDNHEWRPADFSDYPKGYFLNDGVAYDSIKDSRDGKVYKTVAIGNLVWMAENLDYVDLNNPHLKESTKCYKGMPSYCEKLGRLYQWTAAMDLDSKWLSSPAMLREGLIGENHQGICPEGWHIPSIAEWNSLFTEYEGIDLIAAGTNVDNLLGAKNSTGFTALPVGDGNYGKSAWWTSEEGVVNENGKATIAIAANLAIDNYSVDTNTEKTNYKTVRCVKNPEE